VNIHILEPDPSKEGFLQRNLVDYTNVTWLALLFLSRIILPGCFCEAYFLPCVFVLAVYVLKGTRITNNPRMYEYLFWVAIVMNVVVLVTQVFDFYPFIQEGTYLIGSIEEWLRKELGWPSIRIDVISSALERREAIMWFILAFLLSSDE